jgi:hypothetical protein
MNEILNIPKELPLVPMKGAILFPEGITTVRISGLKDVVAAFGGKIWKKNIFLP